MVNDRNDSTQKPSCDALEMTFDPSTIEHLGIRMYSTLPPVMAELIANAYDADASRVEINLVDEPEKQIVVSDNGTGMSFSEVNQRFLRIGRNRREENQEITPLGRRVIGKKGLGKLSFFGISEIVEVSTIKNGELTLFEMNLRDILETHSGSYRPRVVLHDEATAFQEDGTTILLKNVKRRTPFSAYDLAISLSRYFFVDKDFEIIVKQNGKSYPVSEELRIIGVDRQFEWLVPEDAPAASKEFLESKGVIGRVITSKRPLSPEMRGITLYSRGKLVNAPSSFVQGDSSHFYSYMTGFVDVSYLDLLEEDVVSTNRQSLNWDHEETRELREELSRLIRYLERSWRERRKADKAEKVKKGSCVDIERWVATNENGPKDVLSELIDEILESPETHGEKAMTMIRRVHELVPEYARYHWRYLHPEVQEITRRYYEDGNYYTAVLECVKRYIKLVRQKSGSDIPDEYNLLQKVFKKDGPLLKVAEGYTKSDGSPFELRTLENIEAGNLGLAVGMWQGVRNPLNHEEHAELDPSGLFTEKDCLDALSLMSHLFKRLDNAIKK